MRYLIISICLLSFYFTGYSQAPNITYTTPKTYTVGVAITPLTPVNNGGAVPAHVPAITTLAGSAAFGHANGTGAAASFYYPEDVAVDVLGNVYVADQYNNMIRKITPAGVVTTLAGSTVSGRSNGTGPEASFSWPQGVTVDVSGNVYVADGSNNMIRKITPAGVVTTLAGNGNGWNGSYNGTGAFASFYFPTGVALDTSGNIYVADEWNNMIRKITPAGIVSTLAGNTTSGLANGIGTEARFYSPYGVAVDTSGNVYVADQDNRMIWKITPEGVVTTLAGSGTRGSSNGTGAEASFILVWDVAVDVLGNVYVADIGTNSIRKITPAGVVTTLAGYDPSGSVTGTLASARFNNPTGLAVDASGNVYVADQGNNVIRKITQYCYSINPSLPAGLIFDGATGTISGTPTVPCISTAYTVSAINASGASSATINISINNTTSAAVNVITTNSISVYPTPFADKLTISIENNWNGTYAIFSTNGTMITQGALIDSKTMLDLSYLPKGVSLLKITIDGKVQIFKVVKIG